jgi:hypothetical protein
MFIENKMGFKTEFNWVLKLKPENGFPIDLIVGKDYEFIKNEYRVYPIDIAIDLADKDWNVVAKVVVVKFCCGTGQTTGVFRVVKIYDQFEKDFLSDYWKNDVKRLRERRVLTK